MVDKVYCKECAYCYRIHDNYIHIDNDDYHCINSDVIIREDYPREDNPLERPVKDFITDTTCININKKNNCKGFLQLKETRVPIKFLGLVTGYKTVTNKVTEDIHHDGRTGRY